MWSSTTPFSTRTSKLGAFGNAEFVSYCLFGAASFYHEAARLKAQHSLYHDRRRPSYVELPMVIH